MMMKTGIRLALVTVGFGLATIVNVSVAADEPLKTLKIGDLAPEGKAVSLEGIPASLRPPQDKLLLVLVEDFQKDQAIERVKAGITLYRRFHAKGLNAVMICSGRSEQSMLTTAIRWQMPWPLVLAKAEDNKAPGAISDLAAPASYVVDGQGKVVAAGLDGEKAHETVAKLLNVSLDSVPMPGTPEARKEEEQRQDQSAGTPVEERFVARLGTSDERMSAEACKRNLRLISMALTDYREANKGELPEHLSDLFPKYLQSEQVLLCPKNAEMPEGFKSLADPKMKCSYLYEFAPEPRPRKKQQLDAYGDAVPVVRCLHHDRPMSLSYGGEIYFSELGWENEFSDDQTLDTKEARIRRQLRILGSAMLKYKKDKGEMPVRLADLIPDYVKDESFLTCSETKKWFGYRFSPDAGGGKAGRELKLKEAQDPKYGMYVPVIRVKGICENGDVINLGYGGEIYNSPDRWEELFR